MIESARLFRFWLPISLAVVLAVGLIPVLGMQASADDAIPVQDEQFFYRSTDGVFKYYDLTSSGAQPPNRPHWLSQGGSL